MEERKTNERDKRIRMLRQKKSSQRWKNGMHHTTWGRELQDE